MPLTEIQKLEIHFPNHTPHWKVPGSVKGWAYFVATAHPTGEWVSFDTQELTDKSGKRTMLTLNKEQARQLYAMLTPVMAPDLKEDAEEALRSIELIQATSCVGDAPMLLKKIVAAVTPAK